MNKSNSGKQNLCYPGSGLIMNLVDYVDTSINKKYRTTQHNYNLYSYAE